MPITPSEIKILRSSATNSLGGAISNVEAGSDLFDTVIPTEAAAGRTEYRCVYVKNTNSSLALNGAVVTVATDTPNVQSTLSVGVGTSAANGVEQTVNAETTAPSGVAFSASATLGSISAGGHRSYWERRFISAVASPIENDAAVIRVSGSYTEAAQ